jgi:predicted permease
MRDFKALVREQVAPLHLPPEREDKIVREWAAQLAEIHGALLAGGASDNEAWRELIGQLPDWHDLAADLLDREPAVMRVTSSRPAPVAARLRRLLAATREHLTSGLLGDVQTGLRLLVKDRGFNGTVVLTLAICLGAHAAIFTVVNTVLLRPLPIAEADRLVGLGDVYPTITPNDILSNDVPSYFDRLEALTTLSDQAMFTLWFDTLPIDGSPRELRGMRVTPSLFRLLRVSPALGRTFTDEEGETGAGRPIVLSHALWQTLFGGDAGVLGRSVRLGWTGERHTIVGVMPREFSFFDRGYDGHVSPSETGVQFWLPLVFRPEQKSENGRTRYGFFHIGRLEAGATIEQVRQQLQALHAANVKRFPQFRYDELGMYPSALPLQEALTKRVQRPLYLLWGGAVFVLLIGAINIANLSLARAAARRRELATRLALGASRVRLTRQLMIEAAIPAAIGGAGGLAVAAAILRALAFAGVEYLPNAAALRIDGVTVSVVAAASLVVALLIGVLPAAAVRTVTMQGALAEGSRSGTTGRSTRLFRRGLVVAQVGLSVVLLIAATLLLTSFRHLLNVDAGFTASGVVTATVFPPPSRYPDDRAVARLLDRIRERVRAIPGVEATGLTSNIALSGFENPSTVSALGPAASEERPLVPSVVAVTPGYFETMATPLVRGRLFGDVDREGAQAVAIVDERLAARLWPGEDPLGRTIYRGDAGPFTIVGVVRQVRFEGLAGSIDAIGTAYFPHTQSPPMRRLRWLAVRSIVNPPSLVRAMQAAVMEIDPDLPLSDAQTMTERRARSLISERLAASLAAIFGIIALFLSMLGVYGVLANLVARRRREIGIRMALGSTARAVFYLVLNEGVTLIGVGLVLGLAGAVSMSRAFKGLVFGVTPTDPLLLGSVAALTGVVALLACVAPARRATLVDPIEVLSEP